MELSKQQVQTILSNAPANLDKRKLVEGLVARGYTLEGLDTTAVKVSADVQQTTQGNQFDEPQKKGILSGIRDFAVGVIGGGKLAEGAGKAIAAERVIEGQSEADERLNQASLALIKRIREKKQLGEDTARLENALKSAIGGGDISADVLSDFVESLPTEKQVIGSAARLGSTALAPAVGGALAKATGPAATGLLPGIGQGATVGAGLGAFEGAAHGAGMAAEANKPTEELISSGLLGGIAGAATGGVIGGIVGGVGGAIRQRNVKADQFVEQLVAPKQTPAYKTEAIRQGRLTDPGVFRKAEIAASKRDQLIAESVQDVVSPKATIGQNIDAIRLKVDQVDDGVRAYIEANKVPFNTKQLRSRLTDGKTDLDLIFASETNAEKTYDAVVDAFMREVSKKDTLGLFKARQDFDQIPAIKKLLDTDRLGENARKEIVLSVRRAANEYISSLLPDGNPYKPAMQQQTYALEALGNIAEKSANIIGKNQIQILTDRYPLMKWVIGSAIGGSIAGGVGAGAVAISSSD